MMAVVRRWLIERLSFLQRLSHYFCLILSCSTAHNATVLKKGEKC